MAPKALAVLVLLVLSSFSASERRTNMTELITESLPQFAPTTNMYRLADGRYVIVTVPADDLPVSGQAVPLLSSVRVATVAPMPTEVFLVDENAVVLDADGDPSNGMTPLATFPAGTTHAEALAALGYTLATEVT